MERWKKSKVTHCALLLPILLLVCVFHFWELDRSPPGFYVDESSIGYNAYSILRTGSDEHGVWMPLYFKAFGDYKNPIFIYSVVPLIEIYGLSPWTVRLTAALFGLGTAFLFGLIVRESTTGEHSAIYGFALAGLTPWLFSLSRIGFEVISFVFLLALAWWSWLKAIRGHSSLWFFMTGMAWGLSIFAYSTARLIVPVYVLTLISCYLSELRTMGMRWLCGAIPFVSFVLLLVLWSVSNPGSLTARFSAISIWAGDADAFSTITTFFTNYWSYFSPQFLFIDGDPNLRHHTGHGGELFLFTFPAMLCGLVFAWQNRARPLERFTLIAFLLFPLAASLTSGSFHALRTVNGLLFILLLVVWGVQILWPIVRSQKALLVVCVLAVVIECGSFFYDFFVKYPDRARAWFNDGVSAAIQAGLQHKNPRLYYSVFALADENFDANHPYIYFLFFGRLDPELYQRGGLEAFQIYPYQRGMSLPSDSVLLLKNSQEVFTPGGQSILLNNPDRLLQDAQMIAEFAIPARNPFKAPTFQIYHIP